MGGINPADDAELEQRLGYRFTRSELLDQALTHSSAVPEIRASLMETSALRVTANNERLEFLGDAVLELLTSEYLLSSFPDWSEGQLSKSRARLVNAHSLESAARCLHLGDFLRLGRGEEKTGGRDKQTLLADAFEAVLAAIYLDGGLDVAREFIMRHLAQEIEEVAETDGNPGNGIGRPLSHFHRTLDGEHSFDEICCTFSKSKSEVERIINEKYPRVLMFHK